MVTVTPGRSEASFSVVHMAEREVKLKLEQTTDRWASVMMRWTSLVGRPMVAWEPGIVHTGDRVIGPIEFVNSSEADERVDQPTLISVPQRHREAAHLDRHPPPELVCQISNRRRRPGALLPG